MAGKEFTLTFENGKATINLKSYEEQSPKIAADFEVLFGGELVAKDWAPKHHHKVGNHVHSGGGHKH